MSAPTEGTIPNLVRLNRAGLQIICAVSKKKYPHKVLIINAFLFYLKQKIVARTFVFNFKDYIYIFKF